MTPAAKHDKLPEIVIDAAIAWAIKLDFDTPSRSEQKAFEAWLKGNPLHEQAWQRIAAVNDSFDAAPSKIIRRTLNAADEHKAKRFQARRSAKKRAFLIALGAGSAWLATDLSPWQRLLADASTVTGERRSVRLPDGTAVVLNTDSAISTEYSPQTRQISLLRGEIQVTTGADQSSARYRPFWVETTFGRIRALGTRFTVRAESNRAVVCVQESAVALHPFENKRQPVVIQENDCRAMASTGVTHAKFNGIAPDSWVDGTIAGSNIRLDDLLQELARYRNGWITVDNRVAGLRVSGLYHTKNTDQTLKFLSDTLPINVVRRTALWVSVIPAGS